MPKKDYLPKTDQELTPWTTNFETGIAIAANATALGWSAADVTALTNASKAIRAAIANVKQKEADYKGAVAAKTTQIAASAAIIRSLVKRGKTAPTYTTSVGQTLGIIGEDGVLIDWSTYQPFISAVTRPGLVEIRFEKKGADGVNVYTRLQGNTDWQKLAFDQFSPYIDNRPLSTPGVSEVREYTVIAVVNDQEVSQRSNIVSVTFGG